MHNSADPINQAYQEYVPTVLVIQSGVNLAELNRQFKYLVTRTTIIDLGFDHQILLHLFFLYYNGRCPTTKSYLARFYQVRNRIASNDPVT